MAGELPPKVLALLRTESIAAHTHHMKDAVGNIASSNNIARHAITRQINEPSPMSARAVDTVLRQRS